jgi:hypothetical protein
MAPLGCGAMQIRPASGKSVKPIRPHLTLTSFPMQPSTRSCCVPVRYVCRLRNAIKRGSSVLTKLHPPMESIPPPKAGRLKGASQMSMGESRPHGVLIMG